jgi:hypothetical protein
MSCRKNRPILVTGSHRSGSTWVGKMIASHPRILYFSEPFNPDRRDCPVRHMWHLVTPADERQFRAYLRPHCELRYPWWQNRLDEPAHVGRRFLRSLSFLRRRLQGWRPLLKDPMALMSADWLSLRYQAHVVVLIRHPAAFASSLKRLNWYMPVDGLLKQEALMNDYLAPFRDDLEGLRQGADVIDHAIVGWRLFHHVIRSYQRQHPDWLFCRHEDLSLRPVEEFAKIFAFLELDFGNTVRQAIEQHSDEENPREADGRVHQLKRNSKANVWNWQHRLTPDDIARIRAGTRELADHFYGDADWWSPPIHAAAGPRPPLAA